jgi:hypothetical protein
MNLFTPKHREHIEPVKRWVHSFFDPQYGCRALFGHCQGRYTYETEEKVGKQADAYRKNHRVTQMIGRAGAMSLAPLLVDCWPVHFDPQGCIYGKIRFPGDEIVPDHLRGIYEAPFRHDGMIDGDYLHHDGMFDGTYIYDSKNATVADMYGASLGPKAFQAREFGRFTYMDDGVRLYDEMEAFFQRLIPKGSYAFQSTDAAVAALNHAWRPKT